MNNPFKFGTIVDGEYFTDRVAEQEKVREILASENHLILISPRRFGKTSLVQKVTKGLSRPVFQLNLQLVTDTADFAAQLLRIVLQQYPMERLSISSLIFVLFPPFQPIP
jgi:AAA+ ATPase superfamily predicted ATPase